MIVNPNLTPVTTRPVAPQQNKPVNTLTTAEPKERFVSSEMAQMLDNMERAGVLPARVETQPEARPLPEPRGEMAEMLESIQRAEQTFASANLSGIQAKAAPGQNSGAPTSLVMLDEPEHHGSHHPKAHHPQMAGHIGLEVGEHSLHGASHGAAHGTAEATAAKVSHGAAEAATAKATHAASGGAGEVASNAVDLGTTLAVAAGVGAACSGALGVVMLHHGLKEIKQGLKDKNAEHTLEGVGATIVGVRSGLAGVTLAGMATHGSEVLTSLAGGAQLLLAPLGVVHGAIDVGVGTKQLVEGVRENDTDKKIKGGLNVGMGLALGTAALGGGIPALVVAGVILGGKIAHGIAQKRAAQENVSNAS